MKLKLPAYRIWTGSDAVRCPHCGWAFSVGVGPFPAREPHACVFCHGPIEVQQGPQP